jgi:hypothetical protein
MKRTPFRMITVMLMKRAHGRMITVMLMKRAHGRISTAVNTTASTSRRTQLTTR